MKKRKKGDRYFVLVVDAHLDAETLHDVSHHVEVRQLDAFRYACGPARVAACYQRLR